MMVYTGKILKDEKGIALVTSLMLTLITLGISMLMLYMVLQGTQMSGAQKRYMNSLEAATGAVDIVTKDALPYLMGIVNDAIITSNYISDSDNGLVSKLPLDSLTAGVTDACLKAKLTSPSTAWAAASCPSNSTTTNAKDSPDLTFVLKSKVPAKFNEPAGFKVYSKIVATTPGSTDTSGRNFEGMSTTGQPPQDVGAPYLYRIEVTGERESNPQEKANLSVLYAY